MTKFEQQAADPSGVYLYKEGLFVRAYNEGAYGFIHQVMARGIRGRTTISESRRWRDGGNPV